MTKQDLGCERSEKMQSMTGYGSGAAGKEGREISIELKSVNHRYLDVSMRLPRFLSFLENKLRKQIGAALHRGHVDVYLNYINNRDDTRKVVPDPALFREYVAAMRLLAEQNGLPDDLAVTDALKMPDVFSVVEEDEDREAIELLCAEACEAALEGMRAMRAAEGDKLREDLLARLKEVSSLTGAISERAPQVPIEYKLKLEQRIKDMLDGVVAMDEARLANEIALFADRSNIDEELVRLNSHISQFESAMAQEGAVGKKLDFTLQEMNRETNTIGSKANDVEITNTVVKIKCELEKMREQVQNIE
ncbi:MAG: YicC/YloC family endoribonuclease [Christensenellales bacterium]|jgi:uncharacterized protein (TIGR00255 family)